MPKTPMAVRAKRSGAAMPWVLLGMGFATLVAVLAWNRAWTHRERAALQAASWEAQLLAESGFACAADSVWSILKSGASDPLPRDTAARSTLDSALGSDMTDSTPDPCALPPGSRGTVTFTIGDGKLLVPVTASASVPFGSRTIARSIHAVLSGALDRALFGAAVVQINKGPTGLNVAGTRIVGGVREAPTGVTVESYVPVRAVADTSVLANTLKEAFGAPDVFSGGAAYSAARGFPDRKEIVHVGIGGVVEVDIEGPLGAPGWKPPRARTLRVEGDVIVRGRVVLDGWTIQASGDIVLEDDASLEDGSLYAGKSVILRGDATLSGQILAGRSIEISERARLVGSVVAMCGGNDSGRISLASTRPSRGYLLALGMNATVSLERDAVLEGIAISGGRMRNQGAVHGVAVAGAFRCGRGEDDCTGSGIFDRTLLPSDFVVPVGLRDAKGLRVASWRSGE